MKQELVVTPVARQVRIRPIKPGDARGIRDFYAGLSDDSRRRRFLSAGTAVDAADVTFFCGPDHSHREGFIAVTDAVGGEAIVGHLCVEPAGGRAAEIAIAVADAFQGGGIGRRLATEAAGWARRHGVDRFVATCAVDNAGILRLFRGLGRPLSFGPLSGGAMELSIDLSKGPAPRVVAA